mmetsp:Transcript_1324/g.2190  ORF Transcript_1324/g.2190 Transcript_1324/m.2190 type:complete len:94 (-) Transcript_1324:60-341(-)
MRSSIRWHHYPNPNKHFLKKKSINQQPFIRSRQKVVYWNRCHENCSFVALPAVHERKIVASETATDFYKKWPIRTTSSSSVHLNHRRGSRPHH